MKQTHRSRSLIAAMAILSMAWSLQAADRPLTLVKEGQPTSIILIPAAPNQAAAFGAQELQLHIRKITGADVPIVTDRDKIDDGKVQILVGESRATRALGITAKEYQPQEYSLQTKGNAIVLLGYDRNLDYPTVMSSPLKPFPEGRFGGAAQDWAAIGIKDHGFNDERGTMECFLYVARDTNETSTGWMILRVGDDHNGHVVHTKDDKAAGKNYLLYQTFVNGQASTIEVKDAWWARTPGWHHLMFTWDAANNKAEVFLGGRSVGTAPYAQTDCGKAPWFSVRGDPNNIPNCFGPIDEVRVSRVIRKPLVPTKAYETDDDTQILLHFDDPADLARDDSEWPRVSPNRADAGSDRVGSLYAVYGFLEKACGVRWYAPGEEGT